MFISDGETIYEGGDGRLDTQPFSAFRTRAMDEAMWNANHQRQMTINQQADVLTGLADIVLTPLSQTLQEEKASTEQWRQAMWDRSESLGQRMLRVEGQIARIYGYLSGAPGPPPGSMER